jgi:hypothetical protein
MWEIELRVQRSFRMRKRGSNEEVMAETKSPNFHSGASDREHKCLAIARYKFLKFCLPSLPASDREDGNTKLAIARGFA